MPVNQSDLNFFAEMERIMATMEAQPDQLSTLRKTAKKMAYYAGKPADIKYRDIKMHARDNTALRIRHYQFDKNIRPVIIYFPGNAFIYDLFEENHAIISKIAKTANIHAVMVDFRQAPENPYPKPLEDAMDAITYIVRFADSLNIDKDRIVLAGYSSGANLAAVATNQLRSDPNIQIAHQLLISGAYDYTDSLHDYDEYVLEDKMLDPEAAKFSFDCYATEDQRQLPTCSPYWEPDLSNLPPTTIMMGEYDGGRSQGEGYAKKLIDAGNYVDKIIGQGQTHATILYRKICADGPDPAVVAGNQLYKIFYQ